MLSFESKPLSATTTNLSSLYFSLNHQLLEAKYDLQTYFPQRFYKLKDNLLCLPSALKQFVDFDACLLWKSRSRADHLLRQLKIKYSHIIEKNRNVLIHYFKIMFKTNLLNCLLWSIIKLI